MRKLIEVGIITLTLTTLYDTPFMSNCGRETAENTLFEWQTDTLDTAVSTNQQIEGDDLATFSTQTASVRLGNYTNIGRKDVLVSGTAEVAKKAGRSSELAYRIGIKGKSLKTDMEKQLLENLAAAAGSATTARVTAGLGAWVKTNTVKGSGGSDPSYTTVPNAARTDGTQADLTQANFKSVGQKVWASGGNLRMVMAGPVNKQNVSLLAGIATRYLDTPPGEQAEIIGAADVYVSDFGRVAVVPNRWQRDRDLWWLDPDFVSIAYLRPFQMEALAKTGDAEKRMLIVEYGSKVKNEKALGLLADLNTNVLTTVA